MRRRSGRGERGGARVPRRTRTGRGTARGAGREARGLGRRLPWPLSNLSGPPLWMGLSANCILFFFFCVGIVTDPIHDPCLPSYPKTDTGSNWLWSNRGQRRGALSGPAPLAVGGAEIFNGVGRVLASLEWALDAIRCKTFRTGPSSAGSTPGVGRSVHPLLAELLELRVHCRWLGGSCTELRQWPKLSWLPNILHIPAQFPPRSPIKRATKRSTTVEHRQPQLGSTLFTYNRRHGILCSGMPPVDAAGDPQVATGCCRQRSVLSAARAFREKKRKRKKKRKGERKKRKDKKDTHELTASMTQASALQPPPWPPRTSPCPHCPPP